MRKLNILVIGLKTFGQSVDNYMIIIAMFWLLIEIWKE